MDALSTVVDAAPDRIFVRFRNESLSYCDFAAAVAQLLPIMRANQMDDRSAFVAAVFSGIPALSSEREATLVAGVVDRALLQVIQDARHIAGTTSQSGSQVPGTVQIDLRQLNERRRNG